MEVPHPLPYPTIEQQLAATDAGEHWKRIGIRNYHGLVVPLFSLRSHSSCGIGEFCDLLPLIDLCKQSGMNIIQLLPINDTGRDASPYAAISAFALNPIYLSIDYLPYLDDKDKTHPSYRELKDLNGCVRIAYRSVRDQKMAFFSSYVKRHKSDLISEPDYKKFVQENQWLSDYALFKALRAVHLHKGWEAWPKEHKDPSEATLKALCKKLREEMELHTILQCVADRQMRSARAHADKNDLLLMGDVPILVGRDSSDVWRKRRYFDLDLVAGAPPDIYTSEGQNWGLPCYRWDVLEEEDYSFWEERLAVVARHFHLYRVDHIIGFFRIWAIPPRRPAKEGQFTPDTFPEWFDQGVKLMRMLLKKSTMLPIGEDLGIIPPTVRRTLQVLGISGTKVLRWEKWPEGTGPFAPKESYPAASLTTVSTHDAENMRLYWQRYPDESNELASFLNIKWQKVLSPDDLAEVLRTSHATSGLFHINPIQEYLALEEDLTSKSLENERINLPGTLSVLNWSYRLAKPLEELLLHPTFSKGVKSLLS